MAKSIETLMEKLKVLVGKQLSEKQMRGALPVQEADRTIVLCSDKPKNVDVLKKLENGEYLRFKQNFEFMRTPDISYGWEISGVLINSKFCLNLKYSPFSNFFKTSTFFGLS